MGTLMEKMESQKERRTILIRVEKGNANNISSVLEGNRVSMINYQRVKFDH